MGHDNPENCGYYFWSWIKEMFFHKYVPPSPQIEVIYFSYPLKWKTNLATGGLLENNIN